MMGQGPVVFGYATQAGISRRDEIAGGATSRAQAQATIGGLVKKNGRLARLIKYLGLRIVGDLVIDLGVRPHQLLTLKARPRRLVDQIDDDLLTASGWIESPPSAIRVVRPTHPADLQEP
jgi:hypothetical protein